ncbi:MAG: ImuA family protein, partial [Methylovirgula sp.]
ITAQDNRNEFLTKSFNNLNCKAEVLQKLQPRISLGRNSHFDRLLGGGLRLGTLTEILGSRPGDAAAASGFLLGLAARLAARPGKAKAAIIWIGEAFSCREQGEPYGPGLALHGLDPTRLVLVQAQTAKEALWAMEEALKCRAPAVVIGELWSAKPYDLVASRRLLLTAQRHGTPALLFLPGLSGAADHLSSGADLRFEIRAHPSVHPPSAGALPLPGMAAWSVRIAKARAEARAEGFGIDREKFHSVFWDHQEALLRDAVPLALASFSRDRSDRPALARG